MLRVIYDEAQDLTLILNQIDKILLTKEKTREFFDLTLRGSSKTLRAYVYLAYSFDESKALYFPSFNARDLEDLGRIVIPSPEAAGDPWLINLSDKGVRFLESGWPHGIGYNGSNKLFIKVSEG